MLYEVITVERALEVFMLKNEKFSTLTAKNNKNNNYQFYKIGFVITSYSIHYTKLYDS